LGGSSFDEMHLKLVFMSVSVLVLLSNTHVCMCRESTEKKKQRERDKRIGMRNENGFERVTNMRGGCNNVLLPSLYYLLTSIYVPVL